MSGLNTVRYAFDTPTRTAMIPRLVPETHLFSAIGLIQATMQVSMLVGPLLGGFLIVTVGPAGLVAASAVAYIPVVGALLLLGPQAPQHRLGPRMNTFASIGEGLQFVVRDPVLMGAFLLTSAASILARPYSQIMPAIAHDVLHVGALELSWLLASSGLASIVGALFLGRLASIKRRGVLACASLTVAGLSLTVFGQQRELVPALLWLGLLSISLGVFAGVTTVLFQTRAPGRLRGRVLSVQNFSGLGFGPLGIMLFGSLGSLTPLGLALSLGGLAVMTVALSLLWRIGAIRGLSSGEPTDHPIGRTTIVAPRPHSTVR